MSFVFGRTHWNQYLTAIEGNCGALNTIPRTIRATHCQQSLLSLKTDTWRTSPHQVRAIHYHTTRGSSGRASLKLYHCSGSTNCWHRGSRAIYQRRQSHEQAYDLYSGQNTGRNGISYKGLKDVRRYLGLLYPDDGSSELINAVFVSIDVENLQAMRLSHLDEDKPGQIGLSIFDTHDLMYMPPEDVIRSYSFSSGGELYETAAVTKKFVFGKNVRVKLNEFGPAVETLMPRNRNIVLVGHGFSQDLSCLLWAGVDVNTSVLQILDTIHVAREKYGMNAHISLEALLLKNHTDVPRTLFHNGGNDARLTLHALLLMAIRDMNKTGLTDAQLMRLDTLQDVLLAFDREIEEKPIMTVREARREDRAARRKWKGEISPVQPVVAEQKDVQVPDVGHAITRRILIDGRTQATSPGKSARRRKQRKEARSRIAHTTASGQRKQASAGMRIDLRVGTWREREWTVRIDRSISLRIPGFLTRLFNNSSPWSRLRIDPRPWLLRIMYRASSSMKRWLRRLRFRVEMIQTWLVSGQRSFVKRIGLRGLRPVQWLNHMRLSGDLLPRPSVNHGSSQSRVYGTSKKRAITDGGRRTKCKTPQQKKATSGPFDGQEMVSMQQARTAKRSQHQISYPTSSEDVQAQSLLMRDDGDSQQKDRDISEGMSTVERTNHMLSMKNISAEQTNDAPASDRLKTDLHTRWDAELLKQIGDVSNEDVASTSKHDHVARDEHMLDCGAEVFTMDTEVLNGTDLVESREQRQPSAETSPDTPPQDVECNNIADEKLDAIDCSHEQLHVLAPEEASQKRETEPATVHESEIQRIEVALQKRKAEYLAKHSLAVEELDATHFMEMPQRIKKLERALQREEAESVARNESNRADNVVYTSMTVAEQPRA